MDASERSARVTSFDSVAQEYAQHRPEYPPAAVRWLAGADSARVADVGAGTGKLTGALLANGHRVVAVEPSWPMLAELTERFGDPQSSATLGYRVRLVPGLSCVQARVEALPFADSSFDLVVAAQAFHWFDPSRALGEIARVLRPGGAIGLCWNVQDESVPWVRRLAEVVGWSATHPSDPTTTLTESDLFDSVKQTRFRIWQRLDRAGLAGLVSSSSYVASRPRHERQEILAKVRELYDAAARSPEGLVLPYTTVCYRAEVNALSRRRIDADSLFRT